MDNDIVAWHPVDWSSDPVLVASLKRVDDSENLSSIATSRGGVRQDCADDFLRVYDEDRSDGEGNALLIDIGSILLVQHVVQKSDLSLLVTDYGEPEISPADLIDVPDPLSVAVDGVGRQTDQLDTSSCELGLEFRECTQLGGAYGSEVFRVGKEDDPFVADEVVEVDGTLGGLSIKVGSNAAQADTEAPVSVVP